MRMIKMDDCSSNDSLPDSLINDLISDDVLSDISINKDYILQ